jgi:hypothetical protein
MTATYAPDHLSLAAANKLASRIKDHWFGRGQLVEVTVEEVGTVEKRLIYGVRSNMIGGLPRTPKK